MTSKYYAPGILEVASLIPELDAKDVDGIRRSYRDFFGEGLHDDVKNYDVNITDFTVLNIYDQYSIRIKVFKPKNNQNKLPGLVHFHGGGFILGDVNTDAERCARLADTLQMCIVNVDYRLSPESPYPTAVNDGFSVLTWLQTHGDDIGLDINRLGISGVSAGGAIAASLCLLCRDSNLDWLQLQFLWYPALDNNSNTLSMKNGASAFIWNAGNVNQMWQHYLGKQNENINGVPVNANNFEGLPRCFLITCEHDPLKDGSELYARRLLDADIECHTVCYLGTVHGFDTFGDLPIVNHAYEQSRQWLATL
ncbi:MAG: alpha/beta hydrolase [Alteromonadales bacterium]|nr:alpha/beta hydrolase [Alteromonadales bacterium]